MGRGVNDLWLVDDPSIDNLPAFAQALFYISAIAVVGFAIALTVNILQPAA